MDLERVEEDPLWAILVEVVHALPMYPSHKAYVRDVLMHERPGLLPEELSQILDIPLGEALVILHELRCEAEERAEGGEGEAFSEGF